MTSNQSDIETAAPTVEDFAASVAEAVDGSAEVHFGTAKVRIRHDQWIDAHLTARDDLDLVFFSWLSAVDWSKDVEVGDPLSDDDVDERIELLTTVSDVTDGNLVTFSTDLDRVSPTINSLTPVYAGANWHEREAAEMFGIEFAGHPNPGHLYLPDSFQGNPLRKSYPLLSREVKPWPGTVDVEAIPENTEPSTENPEA